MERIRAILYDAGHTLVRPRPDRDEVWSFLGHQLGVDLGKAQGSEFPNPGSFFYGRFGRDGLGAYTSDEHARSFWAEYYAVALTNAGVDLDRDTLLSAGYAVYDWYKDPEQWELFPDTRAALEAAEAAGFLQGVISDWGTDLLPILHAHELTRHLGFVVASAVVGASKPHPDIFRFALDRAGLQPAEAVYVGDSYIADVLGARNAGLSPVLIDRDGKAPAVDCPVVRSLTEVPALIEGGVLSGANGRSIG